MSFLGNVWTREKELVNSHHRKNGLLCILVPRFLSFFFFLILGRWLHVYLLVKEMEGIFGTAFVLL